MQTKKYNNSIYQNKGGEPVTETDITEQIEQKIQARQLKRRFRASTTALLIALLAVIAATYAWYIYNTGRHTTNVRMAAGTGVNLEISNSYGSGYSSASVLESFSGRLTPVSTNRIAGGFQRVKEFVKGDDGRPELVAGIFEKGKSSDYYHTKMYVRTNGGDTDLYLSDIGFSDSSSASPISSAVRVGLMVHKPGKDQGVLGEYIFAISNKKNPQAQYNTSTGQAGYVLDSSKRDGTTVAFTPYTKDAYCNYNKNTGAVSLKSGSRKLCTIRGNGKKKAGTPVEIELYIWLEGCDPDCTANLCEQNLKNLAVSFAGKTKQ